MSNTMDIVTQWVCVDCFVLLVNGDVSPDCENADALLSKFEGYRAMPGMRSEEHCCAEFPDPRPDECDCDTDPYSRSQCDGCGSYLHGERHAVTIEVQS